MANPLLFYAWWLAENSLVHFLAFDFLLRATGAGGRRRLPLWLAVNGTAALAVIFFRPPAAFFWGVLLLAVCARIVLRIPVPDLIPPITVIAALSTLKEGCAAFLLSWLSISFSSPTGGCAEQLLVPLLLDAMLFAALRTAARWYSRPPRPPVPPYLHILLPPCASAALAIRVGLRLDRSDFGPYLTGLGISARLAALGAMAGSAAVMAAAFGAFCGLTRLSHREALLRVQLAEAEKRNERRAAFQHDIHNHLLVISGLLREKSFAQAERYAHRLQAASGQLLAGISTGNPALDVLLREKLNAARRGRITVTHSLRIPEGFGIEDTDLCALFSNILDNAITASLKEPPEARFLSLTARSRARLLIIEAVNAASADAPAAFGTGLANIQRIAEQYHGAVDARLDGGRFRISVLLCSR